MGKVSGSFNAKGLEMEKVLVEPLQWLRPKKFYGKTIWNCLTIPAKKGGRGYNCVTYLSFAQLDSEQPCLLKRDGEANNPAVLLGEKVTLQN